MEIKLWNYKNLYQKAGFFEVEIFHHTPIYKSWQEFIDDDYALSCNCIHGNPLLYWYWENDKDESDDDYESNDKFNNNEKYRINNFNRIILIYKKWQVEMGKIIINVTAVDEPDIRKFIIEQQKEYVIIPDM